MWLLSLGYYIYLTVENVALGNRLQNVNKYITNMLHFLCDRFFIILE